MTTYPFLSSAWFARLHELNDQAGDLPLSPALQTTILALTIQDGSYTEHLHLKAGKFYQGSHPNATATLLTDQQTLQSIITSRQSDVAIDAFMTGKIRIDGDMSAVLALQSAKPSTEQKTLYKHILAMTEF